MYFYLQVIFFRHTFAMFNIFRLNHKPKVCFVIKKTHSIYDKLYYTNIN